MNWHTIGQGHGDPTQVVEQAGTVLTGHDDAAGAAQLIGVGVWRLRRVLRLEKETRLGDGIIRLRTTIRPEEIRIGGIPVMCSQCGARRGRMVICNRSEISIRCQCAHQGVEPELMRADYEAMSDIDGQDYPSLETAAEAVGYDGMLADTTWRSVGTSRSSGRWIDVPMPDA
ncbi:hypothetical protein [Streptomyces tanashiensis]|uniref:hypothetical protein n=1 Tax=Streptomyces tanashiensis TaxID=67367 RepID=UPI0033D2979C